jgi:3-dehydroquinate dehydratase-2
MRIAVINGPNLNMLGTREPAIYGNSTLDEINALLQKEYPEISFTFFQSNHEGELIDFLHQSYHEGIVGIVINPGGYSHTSIALADAIKSIAIPTVEVHISNIYQREAFRQHSYTATACNGVISGLGIQGYILAIAYLSTRVASNTTPVERQ